MKDVIENFSQFDPEISALVTATGRAITTHMVETLGEFLTGKRDPLFKNEFISDINLEIERTENES